MISKEYIQRRINFLLDCANARDKRDQSITYTMRVLSNIATIGKDAGSSYIKKNNKYLSVGALSRFIEMNYDFSSWNKCVINEHRVPLSALWELLLDKKISTPDQVWDWFLINKMVTILKEEDNILKSLGLNSSAHNDRYFIAGIEVTEFDISTFINKRVNL